MTTVEFYEIRNMMGVPSSVAPFQVLRGAGRQTGGQNGTVSGKMPGARKIPDSGNGTRE